MRLWHYELIPYLPDKQLIAQWRELNSIFKKRDKHILINYIYEYPDSELFKYTQLVIWEMLARRINCNYNEHYINFVKQFKASAYFYIIDPYNPPQIFIRHHNKDYLKICCWNLYEKYVRGQTGFKSDTILYLYKIIGDTNDLQ